METQEPRHREFFRVRGRRFRTRMSKGRTVPLSRFRVSGFGLRDSGFGFRVSGFGFKGFGFRVSGFGFRDSGFGFRVSGSRV